MERTEVLGDAGCIFHPTRFRIMKLLVKEKLSISDVAKKLRMERGVVVFHLSILEGRGLVKREYQIVRAPKKNRHGLARNVFWATEKVDRVIADFKVILSELKQEIRA